MYKAIYEYQKIAKSMRLKLSLTLKYDKTSNNVFNNKLVDKFKIEGNDYLKLTPYPLLVIDISDKRSDSDWSPNDSVSLNQYGIFIVKRALKKMLENMKTEDLFVYMDESLVLNKSIAEDAIEKFVVSNKHVMLSPVVVTDDNEEYEGISFMINSYSNYALLTYEEAEFLYDILCNTNLGVLAIELMNISMNLKTQHTREIKIEKKPITEDDNESDVNQASNFNNTKQESAIPDI